MKKNKRMLENAVNMAIKSLDGVSKLRYINQLIKRTNKPKTMVLIPPPINPSQVFFGESLISGVFPKKKPNMYDIISQQIIIETGTRNLK